MPVKPITPIEVTENYIPDVVIETVNDYLKSDGGSQRIVLTQDELVSTLIEKGLRKNEIFDRGWLDFEEKYIRAGWQVEYVRPAPGESGPARFIFSK